MIGHFYICADVFQHPQNINLNSPAIKVRLEARGDSGALCIMKLIPLRNRKKEIISYAKVDDEDYEWLNQWTWYRAKSAKKGKDGGYYVQRVEYLGGGRKNTKSKVFKMHREILGLKHGDKTQCDHIDHDGENNQRYNLRSCTQKQNGHNTRGKISGASKFKGVTLDKSFDKYTSRITGITKITPRKGVWRSSIRIDGKLISLGSFALDKEEDAARAYDEAAKRFFGEFAKLNFPILMFFVIMNSLL